MTELSPLKQALLALEEMQTRLDALDKSRREPIAIIGIGCRFPGGVNDPESLWQLLKEGRDGISEIPADRWDVDEFYDPEPDAPGKMSTRMGGFIDQRVDEFDPQFFGIAPREAVSMDPQQRLLLEVSWEALENAGISPTSLMNSPTGVYVGVASTDYWQLSLQSGDLTRLDAYFSSGIAHSIVSGRLSYILGLQGPSISLDTACSSSLTALHLAVQALRNGECSMALAGGVNLILTPENYVAFSKYGMLSPSGHCKTFDAEADGFGRGEGCGLVVLKRFSDALADGDRIIALIRGTAANQDGPSSGLTAPNGPSQEAVIRAVLENGGVEPADVSYVEAHGTGTPLGDPIEVKALGVVYGARREASHPLAIGSIKTNLGHLEAAAGIAGLIKTALVLQHHSIPPHLHFQTASPYIPWEKYPIVVPTQNTPLQNIQGKFLAGVSAFGFSGTNVHVVMEAAPEIQIAPAKDSRPLELLSLSAKSPEALLELTRRYEKHLKNKTDLLLGEITHTANAGRGQFSHRLAIISQDTGAMTDMLGAFQRGEMPKGIFQGIKDRTDPLKLAFLFTGQGAQYASMGKTLYDTQPTFRTAMDRCASILDAYLGQSLLKVIFPEEGQLNRIDETIFTQPALFAIEYALAQLWMSWGIIPTAVMGHSVGEFVAATLAGVFSLEDGCKLIASRGRMMGELPAGGSMAAVFADLEKVQTAVTPYETEVSIAAVNGSDHVVISGKQE